MATRWFCKQDGREVGPSSFQELVVMIRAGKLHEDDRVRMENGTEWIAVWNVPGLPRAAQAGATGGNGPGSCASAESPAKASTALGRQGAERGQPISLPAAGRRKKKTKAASFVARFPRPKSPKLSRRAVYGLVGVLVLAGVLWVVATWRSMADASRRRARLEAVRAPRPASPSVGRLREGYPVPIPGLEEIEPAFSPCLTADLRTIVFAAGKDGNGPYHLYRAERLDAGKPFGTPALVESCSSGEGESCPTLSSDGLELLFVRAGATPQLGYSSRTSTAEEFGKPAVWSVLSSAGMDVRKWRIEAPQFCDPLHLVFCAASPAAQPRRYFLAERAERDSSFGSVRELPVYTVSGALVCSGRRTSRLLRLRTGTVSLATAGEGPIVWQGDSDRRRQRHRPDRRSPMGCARRTPFHCSPGPGRKLGAARKLWMIRF